VHAPGVAVGAEIEVALEGMTENKRTLAMDKKE